MRGFFNLLFLSLSNFESKAVGCVRVTHAIVQMDFHILSLNKIIIVINMYLIFCTNSLEMEAKKENFDNLMQQDLRMWQSGE